MTNTAAPAPPETTVRLKRSMYLLTMGAGAVITWTVTFALINNPRQFMFSAVSVSLWTAMIIALAVTPRVIPYVERAAVALISLFLITGLFVRFATTGPTAGGALSFVLFSPAVYFYAFLMLGLRRGLGISLGFYLTACVIILRYFGFSPSGLSATGAASYEVYVRFYLSGVLYIALFYAIAYHLKSFTDAKNEAEAVAQYAYTDTLTGVPNRLFFHRRLNEAITHGEPFGLLFIDLDHFKRINDTYGHAGGDEYLQQVARRAQNVMRKSDTVARISGDEFAVLAMNINSPEEAEKVAQKITNMFDAPFQIAGQPLNATASVGASLYPHHGRTAEEVLSSADQAMYHAKAEGRNGHRVFSDVMRSDLPDRHLLAAALQHAMMNNELTLEYQPIYDLTTGQLISMEALARWTHAEYGQISPRVFIPLAEETRAIIPLGNWVLREACRQNKAWQTAGLPPLVMAVNVSALQFEEPDFVEHVRCALDDTGLNARFLELELTESMVVHESAIERLHLLRTIGVQVSLDDFGTGYSSLAQLQRLPIHGFKIDQKFISDLSGRDAAVGSLRIVKIIMMLAEALDLRVVAEGIETVAQLEAVRGTGVGNAQGFLLSKPLTAEAATLVLTQPHTTSAEQQLTVHEA